MYTGLAKYLDDLGIESENLEYLDGLPFEVRDGGLVVFMTNIRGGYQARFKFWFPIKYHGVQRGPILPSALRLPIDLESWTVGDYEFDVATSFGREIVQVLKAELQLWELQLILSMASDRERGELQNDLIDAAADFENLKMSSLSWSLKWSMAREEG